MSSSPYIENNLIHLHSENVELRRNQFYLNRNIGHLTDRIWLAESTIYSLRRGLHASKRRHFNQIKFQNRRWSRINNTFVQQSRYNGQLQQFNIDISQQLNQIHQSVKDLYLQMPSPHVKSVLEWLNKLSQPPLPHTDTETQ